MAAEENITEYIERYCKNNYIREKGLTPEQVREHALVREVIAYYEEEGGVKDEDTAFYC